MGVAFAQAQSDAVLLPVPDGPSKRPPQTWTRHDKVAPAGAKHVNHEYTPVRKVRKRDLPEVVRLMLERKSQESSSSTGKPSVMSRKHSFEYVQGDNMAENLVAGKKTQAPPYTAERPKW